MLEKKGMREVQKMLAAVQMVQVGGIILPAV